MIVLKFALYSGCLRSWLKPLTRKANQTTLNSGKGSEPAIIDSNKNQKVLRGWVGQGFGLSGLQCIYR